MPRLGVAVAEHRRCQVKIELVCSLETVGNAFQEIAFGIEPGDFVFVLVGHELEERPGSGLGELGPAGEARSLDLA